MVSEARPAGGDPTERDPRFTVLVADDDRGTREALAEVLAGRGFRPVLAADGGEAVEIVRVELIHLVLFDMHMPRLTGLEALALLRQTLPRLVPAVLMTADATTELMRQAFQAQVYSVIPKPVNTNIVLHTLTGALAHGYGSPARPPQDAPDHTRPDHPGAAPRPTDGSRPNGE